MKNFVSTRWFQPLLLLVWIALGAGLRFTQLAGKPPWTDEFATLVFSLGNSFQTVPLNQAISLDTLLQPLQPNPVASASTVIDHLITEDHHPPLYFVLAHWWMQLFPASGEYVSLWAARSLPAVFGVASIPALYGLGWLAFRGTTLARFVAQLAAAMMAVSPFGIFLTQEARHYALGILWIIASLCCLVVAVQHLKHRTLLPIWVALCWVVVNCLGMATHYFFSLTLCAEAMALIGLWTLNPLTKGGVGRIGFLIDQKSQQAKNDGLEVKLPYPEEDRGSPSPFVESDRSLPTSIAYWRRIYVAAAGTFVGCLVWVPVWQVSAKEEMTQWIKSDLATGDSSILQVLLSLINPIFQSLAAWITMLMLLPVESPSLPVAIASVVVMVVFGLWAVSLLYRCLTRLLKQADTYLGTVVLGSFVLGAIALFFGISYFLGIDLTRGARYNFVYFPAVTLLLGAALAVSWNASKVVNFNLKTDIEGAPRQDSKYSLPSRAGGKSAVAAIWLMGLLSGITVVSNLGYQKYYRPDLLLPAIQQASSVPVLIATTHNTLVQTGEMMGIAWEFQRTADTRKPSVNPQFLLAHQDQEECEGRACPAYTTLQKTLAQLPRPLDLWLVNFKAPVEPEAPNCFAEDTSQYPTAVNGYTSRLYHCLALDSQASEQP